jgi:hypothetical protein
MPDEASGQDVADNGLLDELRTRTAELEAKLNALRAESEARLIRAEMRTEATRAGMVDLDCLQFVDLSNIRLTESGEVADAPQIIAQLKRSRPWMFTTSSSSSLASTPAAQPPRQKHATEMTDAEYIAARAALLKQRY